MSGLANLPPDDDRHDAPAMNRRRLLGVLAGLGIGTATMQRALAQQVAEAGKITPEMVRQAEWIAGLELTDEERAEVARSVQRTQSNFRALRKVKVDYSVTPAVMFDAAPHLRPATDVRRNRARLIEVAAPVRPKTDEQLAFLPVTELSTLLRTRQVTSRELVKIYTARLKKYDPVLHCVVSYTEELAMKQAQRADREIAAGRYRGPLHGVPWGAKDLIAHPGYKTTWGATPFAEQVIDEKATVAARLEEAGAVLVAKLSLGALAQGDRWFGGMTRNPWNPEQGSSGSSAGSAASVAAGLVGFALGSETLGSIISPSRRCGTTGLRPTFGRVSRHGCMALSWSMDKIGPIARSVEDCALVLDAIHGFDGRDGTAVDQPFDWPAKRQVRDLKIGYVEGKQPAGERAELKVLGDLGATLVPIRLPEKYPIWPVTLILNTEASAVFDDLTRRGISEGLNSWPRSFRQGQFTPAVEYLRAQRVRTLLMREMRELMSQVDMYVDGNDLALTNLTGHPTVVLPAGFTRRGEIEQPFSITLTGRLFGESDLLAVAHAYQQATGHHLKHPPMERLVSAASR
ncbi:MAG: amidase [Planctomycetes bacterium]|nr:amidase [Planctomycetota bacterium]